MISSPVLSYDSLVSVKENNSRKRRKNKKERKKERKKYG